MSHLNSTDVEALKSHIEMCMKYDPPPDNCGALVLMAWMSRHLTPDQFKVLESIETTVGEMEATAWLMLILGSSRSEGSSFTAVA